MSEDVKMVKASDIPEDIIAINAISMALNGLIIGIDETDLAIDIDKQLPYFIAVDTNYDLNHSIQELYSILEFCANRDGGHVEYGYMITTKDFFEYHDANPSIDWAIEFKKHLNDNGLTKLDEPAYWMNLIKSNGR